MKEAPAAVATRITTRLRVSRRLLPFIEVEGFRKERLKGLRKVVPHFRRRDREVEIRKTV
jgi:hypothetical protein